MSLFERLLRYGSVFVAGAVIAFFIARLASNLWPDAFYWIFFSLVVFWLVGAVGALFKDYRSRDSAVFSDPAQWRPEELPHEFRFITHATTLQELEPALGPYHVVADIGAIRYELGASGALFVFFDPPQVPDSTVRGIQLYRSEEFPVFGS